MIDCFYNVPSNSISLKLQDEHCTQNLSHISLFPDFLRYQTDPCEQFKIEKKKNIKSTNTPQNKNPNLHTKEKKNLH